MSVDHIAERCGLGVHADMHARVGVHRRLEDVRAASVICVRQRRSAHPRKALTPGSLSGNRCPAGDSTRAWGILDTGYRVGSDAHYRPAERRARDVSDTATDPAEVV